jgi:hypothetical protein
MALVGALVWLACVFWLNWRHSTGKTFRLLQVKVGKMHRRAEVEGAQIGIAFARLRPWSQRVMLMIRGVDRFPLSRSQSKFSNCAATYRLYHPKVWTPTSTASRHSIVTPVALFMVFKSAFSTSTSQPVAFLTAVMRTGAPLIKILSCLLPSGQISRIADSIKAEGPGKFSNALA